MRDEMKQRLVGALILLSLAVLFWPIIFVPGTDEQDSVSVTIPRVPPVDLTPLPEPDNAGLRSGDDAQVQVEAEDFAAELEVQSVPEDRAEVPARDTTIPVPELEEGRGSLESPELDADGLPIAFSLQVATIGNEDRANTLRDELIAVKNSCR